MIHRALIALTRMIANTFFRRIDVAGIENVPSEGALIFAGNHPNALMDGFLLNATLNAPDWRTLRFIQTARRLYKPATAELSPGEYVELSRRFVDGYLLAENDAGLMKFRDAKVFATIALLPVLYILTATITGLYFGFWWALVAIVALPLSFFSSVRVIEAEVSLFVSMISLLRLTRLGSEVQALRQSRAELVSRIRVMVEQRSDPGTPRLFTRQDFNNKGN